MVLGNDRVQGRGGTRVGAAMLWLQGRLATMFLAHASDVLEPSRDASSLHRQLVTSVRHNCAIREIEFE